MMDYVYIFLFILFLIVIVCLYLLLSKKKLHRTYKSKGPYLLSPGEIKLFEALQHSITTDMYICPKVRIADLVEVNIPKTDKNFWAKFNKISQKHIDFLLCNKHTFTPLLVIELDGGSHKDPTRAQRDEFVDTVFDEANIPILHIQASSFYNYKDLAQKIQNKVHPQI